LNSQHLIFRALGLVQEPTELRTKTQRLMGRQSLVEYIQQNWRVCIDHNDASRLSQNGNLTALLFSSRATPRTLLLNTNVIRRLE
jgi:uncharacterized protein YktB (UPF0637 family)